MTPELIDRIFDHLDFVDRTPKEVDSISDWELITHRPSGTLQWQAAVRLSGMLGGGVSIRFSTPVNGWEKDVYGQVEVRPPFHQQRTFRINPAEWRPRRPHRNPTWGPDEHQLATYLDRWHPYSKNRLAGIDVFLQAKPGLALPLPQGIDTFSLYLHFCGEIWKCPTIEEVPPPPWSPSLL